jgi:hypothetical protein
MAIPIGESFHHRENISNKFKAEAERHGINPFLPDTKLKHLAVLTGPNWSRIDISVV